MNGDLILAPDLGSKLTLQISGQTLTFGVPVPTKADPTLAANVGGGDAGVYRDKIADTINLRTLVGTGGVTITEGADTVTVDVPLGAGSGDVVGPASATDNAVARFDSATGKIIQNSNASIDDVGNLSVAGTVDGRDVAADGAAQDLHISESDQLQQFFNSITIDPASIVVSESVGVVSLSLEKAGGGDLVVKRVAGLFTFDTTPAVSVPLTNGTATVPQQNWVYLEPDGGSGLQIAANTTGWPTGEHVRVSHIILMDAASTAANGALLTHEHIDAVANGVGHVIDINEKLRHVPPDYKSGAATITTPALLGSGPDLHVTTSSAKIIKLHETDMPALDSSVDGIVVSNDATTPWAFVSNMNTLQNDSTGASMLSKSYSLVIWGVSSDTAGDSHLVVNLPKGVYNNSAAAIADASGNTDYSILPSFSGAGFLIARITVSVNGAGTSFTVEDVEDLRGLVPSTSPGGATGGGGTGDVGGPVSSTDNALARFDGLTGKFIQNSNAILDDAGNLSVVGAVDGRDVAADGTAQDSHIANVANPHSVTATQAGAIPTTEKGAANGVATLDGTGVLAAAEIPSTLATDAELAAHTGDTANPHTVTPAQVGNTTAQWNADKLQGRDVVATAPTNGQALVWNNGLSQWEPSTVAGAGDVVGPASSTDNALARFDLATGKLLQNSNATLSDAGDLAVVGTVDGRDVAADGTAQDSHIASVANPHSVTAAQAGAIPTTEKGAANGVATLDGTGVLSAAEIPASLATDVELAAHTGDTANPHSVTPAQVGNTTAQWNASQLQGRSVVATAPADTNVLAWNNGLSQWEPTAVGAGSGDVVGPASSTDNALARFDLATGKLLQNSNATLDDTGNLAVAGTVDGRDVATDGTKLDGIDTGATAEAFNQEAVTTQAITGTDTAVTDTLNATPKTAAGVKLYLNGVLQKQGAGFDYTISGTTITWLALTGTAVDMETSDELIAIYVS